MENGKHRVKSPDELKVDHIYLGRYRRVMPVSLVRMFENALDWEHLPYLHSGSFARGELLERDTNSWLAALVLQPGILGLKQKVRLVLDKATGAWTSTVEEGFSKGVVIYTQATELESRKIRVDVDFYVPRRKKWLRFGKGYLKSTYKKLYDEDESMMVERQARLDAQEDKTPDGLKPLLLGKVAELDKSTPLRFRFGDKPYFLMYDRENWVARRALCPHMLASLENAPIIKGKIVCPWHAYKYDVHTGVCEQHPKLKLPESEKDSISIFVQSGQVFARSE